MGNTETTLQGDEDVHDNALELRGEVAELTAENTEQRQEINRLRAKLRDVHDALKPMISAYGALGEALQLVVDELGGDL